MYHYLQATALIRPFEIDDFMSAAAWKAEAEVCAKKGGAQ